MVSTLGISLCLCLVVGAVLADEDAQSESDLRKHLFEHYDKLVRPVRNTGDVVRVKVELTPVGIKDVDVKDKTIKIDTWLYARWDDQYLTWDPVNYGGLTQLNLPSSEVWKPDLAIYTATPDEYVLPPVHTNVVIFNNGTVLWVPPFTVKSRCPPTENQVTEDTFQCSVRLGSWTYDVPKLVIDENEQDIMHGMAVQSYLDLDPKWTIESVVARSEQKLYACCPDPYSLVTFDFLFRKKPSSGGDD